jgi:hypothetical protein
VCMCVEGGIWRVYGQSVCECGRGDVRVQGLGFALLALTYVVYTVFGGGCVP